MNEASKRDTEGEPIIQTVAEPLHQYLQKATLPPPDSAPTPLASPNHNPTQVVSFRPTNRQPMAMLTVLDDGSREEGETIRIRDSKLTIGREKGDVVIPFDGDMSGQHVELRCQKQKNRFRWFILDQKSTNGTFVRAFRASLSRQSELILGMRRYLFELPQAGNDAADTAALQTQAYRAPQRTMMEQFVPKLTEIGVPAENARSYALGGSEITMGTDANCQIVIEDDPFVSPSHARFYSDETQRWMIEDQKSLNGVWIRVKKFAMDRPTEFQLGQQRFRFSPTVN